MKTIRVLTPIVAAIGLAMLLTGLVMGEHPDWLTKFGVWTLLAASLTETWYTSRQRAK